MGVDDTGTSVSKMAKPYRGLIFESPRRLDLRLVCTSTTPAWRLLDFLPRFPIVVCLSSNSSYSRMGVENIIAALERRRRTSQIFMSNVPPSELPKLIAVMNKPYPILTTFSLMTTASSLLVLVPPPSPQETGHDDWCYSSLPPSLIALPS